MNKKTLSTLPLLAACLLAAYLLTTSVARGRDQIIPDPVHPQHSPAAAVQAIGGTLVVYSAYEVNANFNQRDPNRPQYSDYKVLNADGKLLRRVHNDSGTILQDPAQVRLPAGQYHVVARKNGNGYVTIPVSIEAGQNTVVRL
jgi:hypothetical protein